MFKIIEKQNPLAVHAICDTIESAEHWIRTIAPDYAARGFFMDKTLTADSFAIQEKNAPKSRWVRHSVDLRVVEAVLVKVETWKRGNETKEHVYACGVNVMFEGVRMSASIVRHYLLTGERVQRVPKPVKHRAVVRVGSRTVHLGYFDTIEERDAAKGKHLEFISRKPLTQ